MLQGDSKSFKDFLLWDRFGDLTPLSQAEETRQGQAREWPPCVTGVTVSQKAKFS